MDISNIKKEICRIEKDKNGKNFYRLTLESYKGDMFLNMRKCFIADSGLVQATPTGLTLNVKHLVDLRMGIDAALEEYYAMIKNGDCPKGHEGVGRNETETIAVKPSA